MLPINTKTILLDSTNHKDSEQQTDQEIERANVVILVYDVNSSDCIKRLRTDWIPRINKLNDKIPIILVGNKIDLRSSTEDVDLEGRMLSYFQDFPQVEMGIECSAKGYMNLIDVVYCAQRAVLFPISPLFDSTEKKLKPDYEKALLRIFKICDADCDGYLSDKELMEFQREVFKADLQLSHIQALKDILISQCPEYDTEHAKKGINYPSFLILQKVLIKKMKLQTNWTMLRHFNYGDNLKITDTYWRKVMLKEEEVLGASNIELSMDAIKYLRKQFDIYKDIQTSMLPQNKIDYIFKPNEKGMCPWNIKYESVIGAQGITLDIWIALWQKYFCLKPFDAFKDLVYIGFCKTMKEATQIFFPSVQSLLKAPSNKDVFHLLLLGSNGCGKSTFMDAFIQSEQDNPGALTTQRSVVNIVVTSQGKMKYLVVTEIPEIEIESLLQDLNGWQLKFDAFLLMYENERESIQWIQQIYVKLSPLKPKILLQNKTDMIVNNAHIIKPIKNLAEDLQVIKFQEIIAKDKRLREAYELMIEVGQEPQNAMTEQNIIHIKSMQAESEWGPGWITLVGSLVIVGGAVAYLGWQRYMGRRLW